MVRLFGLALCSRAAHTRRVDLLKWIKSLDEVLFELMSWLVFWPVTLARTAFGPLSMMRYADAQLTRPEEEQYDQALSPPVFLILTLIVTHFTSKSLGIRDALVDDTTGLAALIDNDASAIGVRLVMFAAFPLVFSVVVLAARRHRLDRASLKLPFYAQCYPAAVFAAVLGLSAEIAMLRVGPEGFSALLGLAASCWLVGVETVWMRRSHRFGWPAAFGLSLAAFVMAAVVVVASMAVLLSR